MKDDSDKCKHVFKSEWYGDERHEVCKKCGAMKVFHLALGTLRDDTDPTRALKPEKAIKKKKCFFFR